MYLCQFASGKTYTERARCYLGGKLEGKQIIQPVKMIYDGTPSIKRELASTKLNIGILILRKP